MTYLVDTNVLSETARRAPDERVTNWLKSQRVADTYLSVVTVAEIRRGVELAGDAVRRGRLEVWLAEIKASFGPRILPVDVKTAELAGAIEARCQRAGRAAEAFDALIAATAERHGLTLVTRNVRDFEVWGGPVFDPWSDVAR